MGTKSQGVRELEAKLGGPKIDEEEAVFAEDGTDLTQIRAQLALTPTQRVLAIQSLAQSIVRLRRGVIKKP